MLPYCCKAILSRVSVVSCWIAARPLKAPLKVWTVGKWPSSLSELNVFCVVKRKMFVSWFSNSSQFRAKESELFDWQNSRRMAESFCTMSANLDEGELLVHLVTCSESNERVVALKRNCKECKKCWPSPVFFSCLLRSPSTFVQMASTYPHCTHSIVDAEADSFSVGRPKTPYPPPPPFPDGCPSSFAQRNTHARTHAPRCPQAGALCNGQKLPQEMTTLRRRFPLTEHISFVLSLRLLFIQSCPLLYSLVTHQAHVSPSWYWRDRWLPWNDRTAKRTSRNSWCDTICNNEGYLFELLSVASTFVPTGEAAFRPRN